MIDIVVACIAFAAIGIGGYYFAYPPRLPPLRPDKMVMRGLRLEAIEVAEGSPFRTNPFTREAPKPRDVNPLAFETLVERLRPALPLGKIGHHSFEVRGEKPTQFVEVIVEELDFVEPSKLSLATNDIETVILLAHALVPIFGAIGIDHGQLGWIVVDGTRPAAELHRELRQRYRELMSAVMKAASPIGDHRDLSS